MSRRRTLPVVATPGGASMSVTVTSASASSIRVGDTFTTLGGTYRVVDPYEGGPRPVNRHQRRALHAKRRHRHAD